MENDPISPANAVTSSHRRRRRRERKEKQTEYVTPVASGSTTPRNMSKSPAANAKNTFEQGDDFIPFVFDDVSEVEYDFGGGGSRSDKKGKGKAKDGNLRERISTPPIREHEREWDRGKTEDRRSERNENRNPRKRKHDSGDVYSNKTQRLDATSRLAPWTQGLEWDKYKNVAEMLHYEVKAFTDWISPTPVEDEVRGMIVDLISKAITRSFADAKVLPFGSYETKLYLPLGDIDLVVLSDSMAYSNKTNVLQAIAKSLKRADITSRVTIIAKAKVPIVKFVTTRGRFNVDISINQSNGLISGKIINGFLSNMHGPGKDNRGSLALRSLIFVTKAFLSQRNMSEVFNGGLGGYSVVCLAVSFLQMHPKIRRGEIDAEANLGVLLMEFFELYGCCFNFNEVGISVRDGGTYYSKHQRGWSDYKKQHLLSIEDPVDPSNDISKGSYAFQRVRTTLAGAHGILTATAYLRAGMLTSRQGGRFVRLRKEYDAGDMSILSSILGITQETLNHRKLVQEVYNSRVLHMILGVYPRPIIVSDVQDSHKHDLSSAAGNENCTRSVRSVCEDVDGDQSDDGHYDLRLQHADVDEGRYDIGRERHSRKRQKLGKAGNFRTVYIPEEDDLEGGEWDGDVDYLSDVSLMVPTTVKPRSVESSSKRWAYWLSKSCTNGEVE